MRAKWVVIFDHLTYPKPTKITHTLTVIYNFNVTHVNDVLILKFSLSKTLKLLEYRPFVKRLYIIKKQFSG